MAKEPVFINPLNVPVDVFDPTKRRIQVQPIALKGRHPGGIYEVAGEHYKQFTAPYGSLKEFRDSDLPSPVVVQTPIVPPPPIAGSRPVASATSNLDTVTLFEIQRASADASPQDRADLAAYVLKARAGNKEATLPDSLSKYKQAMDMIAHGDDYQPPATSPLVPPEVSDKLTEMADTTSVSTPPTVGDAGAKDAPNDKGAKGPKGNLAKK